MWIFTSFRNALICFLLIVILVAVLFWLYLNVQAPMQVSAQNANIELAHSLPTEIEVGNYLQTHAQGALDTKINIDRHLDLPLRGKYLADLSFEVTTPITVNINYSTNIDISTTMPLDTTTDLVYQNKLLPEFPLHIDVPIKLSVPFKINRDYHVPIKIKFAGPVYFQFDELAKLHVQHEFSPVLNMNDNMTMRKIAKFKATMTNTERNTIADLNMNIDLPVKNIHQ